MDLARIEDAQSHPTFGACKMVGDEVGPAQVALRRKITAVRGPYDAVRDFDVSDLDGFKNTLQCHSSLQERAFIFARRAQSVLNSLREELPDGIPTVPAQA